MNQHRLNYHPLGLTEHCTFHKEDRSLDRGSQPPRGFPGGSAVKNPPALQEPQEIRVGSLGWEDPLEEGMATHSSILDWRITRTEEPGPPRPLGLQRVEHDK